MTEPALRHDAPAREPALRPAPPRFSWPVDWLCQRLFASIRIAPSAVEHVRELAQRGAVVYVMRQRSWVDYLLVIYVLRREGLPVPEFVNDLSLFWLRPLQPDGARGVAPPAPHPPVRARAARLRGARPLHAPGGAAAAGADLPARAGAAHAAAGRAAAAPLGRMRTGSDYLREIVHQLWTSGEEVSLVPVAVLRGRGMRRKESRLATLVYSVQEMPGEIRRLVSLLWNLRETSISVGVEVPVREITRQYHREGEERVVRRLTRALQIFLYREERVVWGPRCCRSGRCASARCRTRRCAPSSTGSPATRAQPESQLWRQAERYFDEMAANFHGIYFSFLEFVFNRIWPRLFQGFEYSGLDKVLDVR